MCAWHSNMQHNIYLSRAPPDKYTTRRCNRKYHHTFLFMHNLWHLLQIHAVNQQRNSWLLLVSKHTRLYPGYLFNVITYRLRAEFLYWSRDPWTRCNKTVLLRPTYPPTQCTTRCTRHFTTSCKYICLSLQKIISSRCRRLYYSNSQTNVNEFTCICWQI